MGRDGGDPARHDLAALRDETLQKAHVLVIDLGRVRARERAGFAPAEEWPAGSAATAAAGGRGSGLAFHLGLHLFRGRGRLAGRRTIALTALAIAVSITVATRPVLAA